MFCLKNNHTDIHLLLKLFFPAHGESYPVLGNMMLYGGSCLSGMYVHDMIRWMCLLKQSGRISPETTIQSSFITLRPLSPQAPAKNRKLMRAVRDDKAMYILFFLVWHEPGEDMSHANVVIVDRRRKTVERFEPHGRHDRADSMDQTFVDFLIANNMDKLHYIRPNDLCCNGWGPQRLENSVRLPPIKLSRGYCGIWSMIYAHSRMQAPDRSARSVHTNICKTDRQVLLRQVTSYAIMIQAAIPGLMGLELTEADRRHVFDRVLPPIRLHRGGVWQWLKTFLR